MSKQGKVSQLPGDKLYLLYGFGESLASVACYLKRQDLPFIVYDDSPLACQRAECLGYTIALPGTDLKKLDITDVVISPGIPMGNPIFAHPARIWNDISLFFNFFDPKNVIAITGTFGKSTTVEFIKHIYQKKDSRIQIGGNIGIPIFDNNPNSPIILELSAQQLELCNNLDLDIAAILNIYPHHLDRYSSLEHYTGIKQKIYSRAKVKIINSSIGSDGITISNTDIGADYFFDGEFLWEKGRKINEALKNPVISEIAMVATFAILRILGFSEFEIISGIADFPGLPHRCEIVRDSRSKITFVNDSKSTSLLNSAYCLKKFSGRIGWIVGGQLTGQINKLNLSNTLKDIPELHYVATIGETKQLMFDCLNTRFAAGIANTLQEGLHACIDKKCDTIIFSPGHKSFDMYKNFVERGTDFKNKVKDFLKKNGY